MKAMRKSSTGMFWCLFIFITCMLSLILDVISLAPRIPTVVASDSSPPLPPQTQTPISIDGLIDQLSIAMER